MSSRPISTDPCEAVRRDAPARVMPPAATAWLDLRVRARRAPLALAMTLIAVSLPLCLACALLLDVPVARAALEAPTGLRRTAEFFSDLGLSGYMLVLSGVTAGAAFAVARRGRFPDRDALLTLIAERACFVFAAVATSGIAVQILKHTFGRARPRLIDTLGPYHFELFSLKASLASFPSGHATSIFALATALGLIVPRLRLPMFGLAVLVGLARVVLAAHYASDVLAGAAFGVMMALATVSVLADRSIAFTRAGGELRLKGRGMIWAALRAQRRGTRAGA